MKKFYLFLGLFGALFCQEYNYAPKVEGDLEEKPLVVVIPSYNNKRYCWKNLESVFTQNYNNFRVIYTNDASTDNTDEFVKRYVKEHGEGIDFTYILNETNRGAVYNIYHMIHSCRNDEIILLLDGDDYLYDENVFDRINRAYHDDRVWMTYGMDKCDLVKRGHSKKMLFSELEKGEHRKYRYQWSHLRTFYAGIFKTIPKEKLMIKNRFYPVAGDVAIGLFMLDRVREHAFFVEDLTYFYNAFNPLNDFRRRLHEQKRYRKHIWQQEPLERLHDKSEFL